MQNSVFLFACFEERMVKTLRRFSSTAKFIYKKGASVSLFYKSASFPFSCIPGKFRWRNTS